MKKQQLSLGKGQQAAQNELKEQIELINAHGISPDKMMNVVDSIINGDLTNTGYKKSEKALIKSSDKAGEASRIINNYQAALASLASDKKSGKDDEAKAVLKLSIIVGAASAGLHALGLGTDDINFALGLS